MQDSTLSIDVWHMILAYDYNDSEYCKLREVSHFFKERMDNHQHQPKFLVAPCQKLIRSHSESDSVSTNNALLYYIEKASISCKIGILHKYANYILLQPQFENVAITLAKVYHENINSRQNGNDDTNIA